jgi:hypothetical protein
MLETINFVKNTTPVPIYVKNVLDKILNQEISQIIVFVQIITIKQILVIV